MLHEGKMFGLANQLLMLLACLLILLASVSGLVMWWKRRPQGRFGVPPLRHDLPLWKGGVAIMFGLGLLFPLVGETKDRKIKVDGEIFDIPRHGFARTSRFTLVTAEKAHCVWRLDASDATRRQYPFEFRLDVTYRIDGGALHMVGEVTNRGDRAMPASFGFHPALRWPLPSGASREAHEIVGRLVREAGFEIGNIAVQVVGNRPKVGTRRAEAEARGWKPKARQREVSSALKIFAMLAQSADKWAARRSPDEL